MNKDFYTMSSEMKLSSASASDRVVIFGDFSATV